MEEKNYITEEKKQSLVEELNFLKNVRRQEILDTLQYAKSLGDLSENAEYHQAREDQGKLEDRINQIEYMLQSSEIVKKHKSDKVEVGTTVTLKKDAIKENITYDIVGAEEADMANNKISTKSLIGQALFGHKKGDVISVQTPKGLVKYTILDIK